MGLFDFLKKDKKTANYEASAANGSSAHVTKDDIIAILTEIERVTRVPFLKITLSDEKPAIADSKVGGIPYVHYEDENPVGNDIEQLRLLAQINCRQVSETLDCFAPDGLIQIFINRTDKNYGLDRKNQTNQIGFRVKYIENIDPAVTEYESSMKTTPYDDGDIFPVKNEYKMILTPDEESVSIHDYRFNEMFVKMYNKQFPNAPINSMYDIEQEFLNEIYSRAKPSCNKIGGYPNFNNDDPRTTVYGGKNLDTLIIQLESNLPNEEEKVMFGDHGTCNFFVNGAELYSGRTGTVLYNWDTIV